MKRSLVIKKKIAYNFCICFLPCVLSLAAYAAPPSKKQVKQAHTFLEAYHGWMNSDWTENDQKYQNIRQKIDKAYPQQKALAALVKSYRQALTKTSNDPRAQFGYYYSTYNAANLPGASVNSEAAQTLGDFAILIVRTPHPRTYNYIRLGFLCQMYCWSDPKLRSVGKRLALKDPDDYDVNFYAAALLASSASASDQALASSISKNLIHQYPDKPGSYRLAGLVHQSLWRRTKSAEDAAQAIASYKHYLQLAPSNYGSRGWVKKQIAEIEQG